MKKYLAFFLVLFVSVFSIFALDNYVLYLKENDPNLSGGSTSYDERDGKIRIMCSRDIFDQYPDRSYVIYIYYDKKDKKIAKAFYKEFATSQSFEDYLPKFENLLKEDDVQAVPYRMWKENGIFHHSKEIYR